MNRQELINIIQFYYNNSKNDKNAADAVVYEFKQKIVQDSARELLNLIQVLDEASLRKVLTLTVQKSDVYLSRLNDARNQVNRDPVNQLHADLLGVNYTDLYNAELNLNQKLRER